MAEQFAKAVEILARVDVSADVRNQAFVYLEQVRAVFCFSFTCCFFLSLP